MSKRKIILAALIPLLILVGVVAFKLWAAQKEKILPGPAPVASATASPTKEWVDQEISFDGSESYDKDIKATWDEVDGKKYNYQEVEIDGVVEKWEWKFGDGNTGSGETTTHTYTKPDVSDGHQVTLKITDKLHGETAEATTSVQIWPYFGVLEVAGPERGVSGQPCTFKALVWDSYGRMWVGSEYPTLTYRWWHCGMDVPPSEGVLGGKTHSFTWEVPWWMIKAEYVVMFHAKYTGPNGESMTETSNGYEITIWRWGRRQPGPPLERPQPEPGPTPKYPKK